MVHRKAPVEIEQVRCQRCRREGEGFSGKQWPTGETLFHAALSLAGRLSLTVGVAEPRRGSGIAVVTVLRHIPHGVCAVEW